MQVKLDLHTLFQLRHSIGFRIYMPVSTPQGISWATASYTNGFVCSRPGGAPQVWLIDQLYLIKAKDMRCACVKDGAFEWVDPANQQQEDGEVYFVPAEHVEKFEGFFA